jgi:hypothetical protein
MKQSPIVFVKYLCVLASVLIFGLPSVFGQASIGDLSPAHAAQVEAYLAKNKRHSFRAETVVDGDYLRSMRESLGKTFRLNYVVADLNGDRINDFAVLLNRAGKPTNQPTSEHASKEHFPDHPLTLVVFNGVKGGEFRVAFTQDLDGPRAAFIHLTTGRKKRLYYGIFETDADIFTLVPAGRGYVIK